MWKYWTGISCINSNTWLPTKNTEWTQPKVSWRHSLEVLSQLLPRCACLSLLSTTTDLCEWVGGRAPATLEPPSRHTRDTQNPSITGQAFWVISAVSGFLMDTVRTVWFAFLAAVLTFLDDTRKNLPDCLLDGPCGQRKGTSMRSRLAQACSLWCMKGQSEGRVEIAIDLTHERD